MICPFHHLVSLFRHKIPATSHCDLGDVARTTLPSCSTKHLEWLRLSQLPMTEEEEIDDESHLTFTLNCNLSLL